MKKGQISAEMLIVLVLILGLVFIIYSQLSSNVKKMSASTEQKTQQIIEATKPIPDDISCVDDYDCQKIDESWTCDTTRGKCQG